MKDISIRDLVLIRKIGESGFDFVPIILVGKEADASG